MIQVSVNLDLSGLQYAKGSGVNKCMRIALNKAASPVKSALVSAAPRDSGGLRDSIKIKTTYYKNTEAWAAIVGPSKSFSRARRRAGHVRTTKAQRKRKRQLKRLAKRFNRAKKVLARVTTRAAKSVAKVASRQGQRGRRVGAAIRSAVKRRPRPKPPKARKKRPFKGGRVRPSRYASQVNWGTKCLHARHYLERALGSSKHQYANTLTASLRSQLPSMFR